MKKHSSLLLMMCSLLLMSFSPIECKEEGSSIAAEENCEVLRVVIGSIISENNGCYTFQTCDGGIQYQFEDPDNILPYPWPETGYLFIGDLQYCGNKRLANLTPAYCF